MEDSPQKQLQLEQWAGLILIAATILALAAANSQFADSYHRSFTGKSGQPFHGLGS